MKAVHPERTEEPARSVWKGSPRGFKLLVSPEPLRRGRGPSSAPRPPAFLAGDIVLFASTGDAFSNAGRWLMRGPQETPTYAVHTGQFLDARRLLEMDSVARITTFDAVLKRRYWQGPLRALLPPAVWAQLEGAIDRRFGRYRRYWQGLWKPRGFEVWRCPALTAEQRGALTRAALRYVNVRFGFLKFTGHALDNVISKLLRHDVFVFRHMDPADQRPVCSGITATVYDQVLHYRFGVDPECADPDHIYDWVHAHPGEWVRVFRLDPDGQVPARRVHLAAGRADPPAPLKGEPTMVAHAPTAVPTQKARTQGARLTSKQVWRELAKASFAIISYVTPAGEPRSSGIMYKIVGRRLVLVVAADSWKARQIRPGGPVAVTVPVRRGGPLSLLLPIPPATVSFHARAIVHPPGDREVAALSKELASILPSERRASACVIELLPEGTFLTYGLGVTLAEMRNPAAALAHVPVA